ncbi:helix-turn-helix domain-containing protein [Pseudomonas amygdali]|uniref:DNA-binding protein n=2 Tax=Pseudomonas amygdali pv. lachrymans TaxID=53707 RepID=A0ABR5KQE0_PSEAV|nr:helix-turn-helix transcriptional regulator [Pseudomonas amygdali]AXH59601.1 XRE family transcriptional regulator [Pseudomonas amygdali pv. lachrymans str. M301315]KPC17030.1 putative DNA-binding protein [Pseudomonas amygdali pv. lachrymans]KPC17989.1 putative DNA-binding protein [Pseudomonas amygdali pv. lachrymans]RMT05929.1 putative DNA-binding protein [Pseudomonas amygdali pv. lachrymans]
MQELNAKSTQALINLGQNIETARRIRGLNQKEICQQAGITPQTYRRLIQGDPGISLGVLFSVCQVMGVESMLSQMIDPKADAGNISVSAQEQKAH